MGAYEATILDVVAEGDALLEEGHAFRLENLQLCRPIRWPTPCRTTPTLTMANGTTPSAPTMTRSTKMAIARRPDRREPPQDNVRNSLLDAVDLYRVAVGWPTEDFTTTAREGDPRLGDGRPAACCRRRTRSPTCT